MVDNYTTLLERIRISKKLTMEEFIGDIVKLRTYANYVSGNTIMPTDIFFALISKYNLSVEEVFNFYNNESHNERVLMNALYNAYVSRNLDYFHELRKEAESSSIIFAKNRLIYDFTILMYEHTYTNLSDSDFLKNISSLIDYPNCLSNLHHTEIELMILGEILYLESEENQERIINLLKKNLNEKNLISSTQKSTKTLFLVARLANFYGLRDAYNEVLDLCEIGIKISKYYHEFYLLEYIYYYQSLSYNFINDIIKRNESLLNCYRVLCLNQKEFETSKFLGWFKEDFPDLDINDFLKIV